MFAAFVAFAAILIAVVPRRGSYEALPSGVGAWARDLVGAACGGAFVGVVFALLGEESVASLAGLGAFIAAAFRLGALLGFAARRPRSATG